MLRYYSVWASQRHVPKGFLLVRYEDLRENPARELRRIAEFIGLHDVSDAAIAHAVEFSSFEQMRQREAARPADGTPLAAGRRGDPESFKTPPRQSRRIRGVHATRRRGLARRQKSGRSSIRSTATEQPTLARRASVARPPRAERDDPGAYSTSSCGLKAAISSCCLRGGTGS